MWTNYYYTNRTIQTCYQLNTVQLLSPGFRVDPDIGRLNELRLETFYLVERSLRMMQLEDGPRQKKVLLEHQQDSNLHSAF